MKEVGNRRLLYLNINLANSILIMSVSINVNNLYVNKLRVKKVNRFFFRTKKTCSYEPVLENYQFL